MSSDPQPARFTGAILGASGPTGAPQGARYRLGRLLGEGGMGSVYEAGQIDPADNLVATLAVKILHEEMAQNPIVVERFLGEGEVCRRLDHPGILRIFDVGNQAGVPYLVMEMLQGRALVEYTEHGQRLPLHFAVTVCAGVLNALEYAHANGVIHRDLKPENVFLVPTGQGSGYQTKLLDFGIAKSIDAAGGGRKRTATGVLLGTPGYMSPEQVRGAAKVDHRTDLWAVGVMFYEMLAGSAAFPPDGDDPNNIWGLVSAVLSKEPVPLSLYDKHLVPFDAFIARALAKDLAKRYGSAREMSDDLLRIARSEVQGGDRIAGAPSIVPGALPQERVAVPINSRGELTAIPAVQTSAPAVAIGRTVSSGASPAQAAALAGTALAPPAYGAPIAATAYAPAAQLTPGAAVHFHAPPPVAAPGAPPMQHGYSGSMPIANAAPTANTPAAILAATVPAQHDGHALSPFAGTTPSGYAAMPNAPGPAPVIPNNARSSRPRSAPPLNFEGETSSASATPWIIAGVVLVLALVAALYWASH